MKLKLQKNLQPGTYRGKVKSYETINSKYGEALKITYALSGGQEANELCNMYYSPGSKLGQRVRAITGNLPEDLNIDELLGKPVVIELVPQADKPEYCRVATVARAQAKPAQATRQAPAPPPEPEEVEYYDEDDFDDEDAPF